MITLRDAPKPPVGESSGRASGGPHLDSWRGPETPVLESRRTCVRRSSEEAFARARREASVAQAANEDFTAGAREKAGAIRAEATAENLLLILDHLARGERVVVWSDNPCASRTPYLVADVARDRFAGVGFHLARALGDRLVSAAASFDRGRRDGAPPPEEAAFPPADPQTLDGALARTGLRSFLVDLRAAPAGGPVAAWLGTEHRLRAQDVEMVCAPRRSFDAVYYVAEISR
jgi:erythromycin esterase-like protein